MSLECKHPEEPHLWRYGIISPLLHCHGDSPSLQCLLDELAERTWYPSDGTARRYCADTLRSWLERYREAGVDGLYNKPRKDKGRSSIPEALTAALADVRKSQPEVSAQPRDERRPPFFLILTRIRNKGGFCVTSAS